MVLAPTCLGPFTPSIITVRFESLESVRRMSGAVAKHMTSSRVEQVSLTEPKQFFGF